MQLVLVEELVERIGAGVVFFVLLLHDGDVVNELREESLHAFGRSVEPHDLIQ